MLNENSQLDIFSGNDEASEWIFSEWKCDNETKRHFCDDDFLPSEQFILPEKLQTSGINISFHLVRVLF